MIPRTSTLGPFLVGRVLTAIGGGALVPIGMAVIGDAFREERRARALGILGAIDTLGWVWGPLFGVGHMLSALALTIIVLARVSDFEPMKSLIKREHFHNIGNLTFAFVILWTYMTFGQFLIIWSGNLPEEITWYLDRRQGGWRAPRSDSRSGARRHACRFRRRSGGDAPRSSTGTSAT